jgi:glutaredoxin-related protein
MQSESWNEYIPHEDMNITDLSKTIRDSIDSLKQGVAFRDTNYRFDEASLKDYLCTVCKNNDNRKRIVKKNGALALTFVYTLKSGSSERFSLIINAIKDEPDLKGLADKLKKIV